MRIKGKYLVNSEGFYGELRYQKVKEILDYKEGHKCIIVRYLNPDFTILLDNINVIITQKGSELAHLSIMARENCKDIILLEKDIFDQGRIIVPEDPLGIVTIKVDDKILKVHQKSMEIFKIITD